jgi:prepilin-type N-terminal cleavage/methylation domain-containing protein
MRAGRFGGRGGVTLVEMIVAIAVLTLGVAGLHALLEASERASGRIRDRAEACSMARRAAAQTALEGYGSVWKRVWTLEPGAATVRSRETGLGPGGAFSVSVLLRRLENDGVLIQAFSWRQPERSLAEEEAAAAAAKAPDADKELPLPPSGSLWEKVELGLYPPLARPASGGLIQRARRVEEAPASPAPASPAAANTAPQGGAAS